MDRIGRASWRDRFGARLIDVLIVGIGWVGVANAWDLDFFRPAGLTMFQVLLFVYWTLLEGYTGASLWERWSSISQSSVPMARRSDLEMLPSNAWERPFCLPLTAL